MLHGLQRRQRPGRRPTCRRRARLARRRGGGPSPPEPHEGGVRRREQQDPVPRRAGELDQHAGLLGPCQKDPELPWPGSQRYLVAIRAAHFSSRRAASLPVGYPRSRPRRGVQGPPRPGGERGSPCRPPSREHPAAATAHFTPAASAAIVRPGRRNPRLPAGRAKPRPHGNPRRN